MPKSKGKLIVIDGLDGSGKATQTKLLLARLRKEGYKVAVTDFPQYYTAFFGKMVGRYLSGEFGKANQVSPYLTSILYALDRWQAKEKMQKWLKEDRIIVSNRYVSANQIHQTAKIKGGKEKEKFLKWLDEMEFKVLGIPRPNLILYLNIPFQIGQRLVIKKGTRGYIGGVKRDIHERDKNHLTEAQKQCLVLARKFVCWREIKCIKNGVLLSKNDIAEVVWRVVKRII